MIGSGTSISRHRGQTVMIKTEVIPVIPTLSQGPLDRIQSLRRKDSTLFQQVVSARFQVALLTLATLSDILLQATKAVAKIAFTAVTLGMVDSPRVTIKEASRNAGMAFRSAVALTFIDLPAFLHPELALKGYEGLGIRQPPAPLKVDTGMWARLRNITRAAWNNPYRNPIIVTASTVALTGGTYFFTAQKQLKAPIDTREVNRDAEPSTSEGPSITDLGSPTGGRDLPTSSISYPRAALVVSVAGAGVVGLACIISAYRDIISARQKRTPSEIKKVV